MKLFKLHGVPFMFTPTSHLFSHRLCETIFIRVANESIFSNRKSH